MYELIIIDDEFIMRDGMLTLINWEELGFHVAAVLDDGSQGIEWITQHKTDVVLTDLRMAGVTGIDIARFVYENSLPMKVVLISGHSDFSAAQQAMELRVDAFLLKPISIKRIKDVFMRIYEELNQSQRLEHESLDAYLLSSFTEDLMCGVLQKPEKITKYFAWLDWERFLLKPCAFYTLKINNCEHILSEFEEDMISVIEFIWNSLKKQGIYIPLKRTGDLLFGLRLDAGDDAENDCLNVLGTINAMIDVQINLRCMRIYPSVFEMAASWSELANDADASISLPQIRQRQQIILTYMLKNDLEQAQNHYYAFVNSMYGDIDQCRDIAVDFFAGLVERLRNDNRLSDNDRIFPYKMLMDSLSIDMLRSRGGMLIKDLIGRINRLKTNDKREMIAKVCTFIDQNFQDNVTLEQASAYIFLSPVYFSKLFKDIVGKNYKDYLIEKRISHACELLTHDPQLKVQDISRMVGYNNEKYFYQVFSRIMDCTPMEYRARHLNNTAR